MKFVTSDNWHDPVLDWWRRYFGPSASHMLPAESSVYHRSPAGEFSEEISWRLSWVRTPYFQSKEGDSKLDGRHLEHACLVGYEPDYTWVLIPRHLKEAEYLESEALQKRFLLFGWYKDRGCTEHVLAVDFRLGKVERITYEELRELANSWQKDGMVVREPRARPWEERAYDVWVPGPKELDELMEVLDERDPAMAWGDRGSGS